MHNGGTDILFIVMDTVRKDHLSVYGYDRPTTPSLERFADEATVFHQAVSPSVWTLPVHASLFTGLYPSQHGAHGERPYLQDPTTLAGLLSDGGYETACYSANPWLTPYCNLTVGFDEHDNFADHFIEWVPGDFLAQPLGRVWRRLHSHQALADVAGTITHSLQKAHGHLSGSTDEESADSAKTSTPRAIESAKGFMEGTQENSFVFLNFMDAHAPYESPSEYREEFAPGVDPERVCLDAFEYDSGVRSIDESEWESIKGLYDAAIRYVDDEIGRLFDWMRERGLWDDTMVVVCADHGELHGRHGIYDHKFCVADSLVNVPLLIKHPRLKRGTRTDQVELLDLYHTLLDTAGRDAAGAPVPRSDSRSLLRAEYRDFSTGEYAFIEHAEQPKTLRLLEKTAQDAGIELADRPRFHNRIRAIRTPEAKFVRNANNDVDDEYYDLREDPDEQTNLIHERAPPDDLVDALRGFEARVGEWTDQNGEEPVDVVESMDESTRSRLRDLGYIE